MQLTRESAEKIMSDMSMPDMPLMEYRPVPAHIAPDWFPKYKRLCRQFMQSLSDSVDSVAFLNLSQDEFIGLIMGQQMPANLSIRTRVPLVWGGKLELDNLFLCWTFPHSHNLDRFLMTQSGAETVWLPSPAKKVYVTTHTAGGGDGGNATEDRLTQLAAQIAASRGME